MTLLGDVPREPRVSTRPPQVRGVVCKREGRQTFSVAPIQSVRLTAGSRGAQEIGIPIKLLQTRRRALLTGGAWIETPSRPTCKTMLSPRSPHGGRVD